MTEKKVIAIAKEDIKKNGSYAIPKNHPDNELTKAQVKNFAAELKVARGLVKKGVLEIEQDDRRIVSFVFPDLGS